MGFSHGPIYEAQLRVLLVEDSADDAELLRRELVQQGYSPMIERVQTKLEFEQALEQRTWDVLLCDHALPTFDAMAALSIMKERGLDLPFIVVSNMMAEATAIEIMRVGAHDCLLKRNLARLGAVIEREVKESKIRADRARMQQQLVLSDRLVSIGTLAAGVAHEIHNPLAYVLGNIELALERLTARDPSSRSIEETQEVIVALREAREGTERIRITTRDLKVFCHSDETEPAPVNIRRIMESSINMALNEIRHRARLSRHFTDVPAVLGNENRLGQVFLNLLMNAAHAIPEGDAGRHEIAVTIRPDQDRAVVEIRDTGHGIAPEVRARLFEPFFTTKPRGMGTGLGLSICHNIIADLGGEITVDSQVGIGTVFRVALPVTGDASLITLIPSCEDKPMSRRVRVLVIDDEPKLGDLIRRMLREHDVCTMTDARQALSLLERDASYDVIFCDVMMPLMSGSAFHKALARASPRLAKRVVFLTGGAFGRQARQFLDEVPNARLAKPFDAKGLRAAIVNMLAANELMTRASTG